MAPLRMPQHLAEPAHVDSGEALLKFARMEELDALRSCEREVKASLRALADHDADGGPLAERARLLDRAADATWRLIVQHEACDCCDHHLLVERYRIPAEVMARIGSRH